MLKTRLVAIAIVAAAAALPNARAGEVYANLGFPGVMLGYAHPVNEMFSVRGDFATLGNRERQYTEEGISYQGTLKAQRAALLADWYPLSGSFRFTLGATSNNYKLNLNASGAGGTLTIGNNTYVTTAADRFEATVKFPKTTPYIGFGWGHQQGEGLRFSVDLGAMVGKAKLTTAVSGPLASQVTQQDIDAETAELRDGVGKVRAIPQITLGIGYSF